MASPSTQIITPAVTIRNAYKRYSTNAIVLNGLNLTVPDRSIYGLLGPSGCGKTTLLNCIVGTCSLDEGSIKLKVQKRSDIGYMPQAMALHDRMTINENFFLYGVLHGMTLSCINERSKDLISFLELPNGDNFVNNLSGGQQRRVSIAVALIHDPKMVVLDEPTVGLDPVLSNSIWNRLVEMAARGKSIIITTHYIQEAKQAHVIGLMREGKILAEQPPQQLMEKCNCKDLEEAFLVLSHKQEVGIKDEVDDFPRQNQHIKAHYEDDERRFSVLKFKAILYKNITLLKREYIFFVFVIVLPLLQIYLFNVAIGGKPKNLPLAVINKEISTFSCPSTSNYEQCFLTDEGYNDNVTLSCLFLDFLKNQTYNFVDYANDEDALNDVRNNKVWGILHFHSNYTSSMANRVLNGFHATEQDLTASSIDTWIDLSNQYIGNFVKYDIAVSMASFLKEILVKCDMNPKIASIPIAMEKPIIGSFNGEFLGYASSAMLCLICFFFPMILSAGLILTEKIGGMLERMMVAGVKMSEMLLSAVAIQLVIHIIQTFLAMVVMYWCFPNPLEGSVISITALMIFTGVSGMFFGFMLGIVNKDMMSSSYVGIGINLALCLTSGLLWPVEAEHYILKSISWLLPLTWTAEAARAISIKNFSFFHPLVIRGFASTIVWNIIFLFVMYLFIKYKKDGLIVNK